ncbi:type II toxin-antitoxin system VapC family toxin [Occultella gossypii]|uniref:Ribonuclease VapC n=1 Tax=Occultella gossypii TaxID=2800820 RepID=A0ABS7SC27_9MICO|nr:type II toxin-antitoxin system VapC family toxin [Occultella gossypii]MBZ2196808.1 type II toxin-antitoxin system VapC family toxin [Occultella gossypii]
MKLVDANVLLYAYNTDADRHLESRVWLDGALTGAATVGFAWVPMLAFIRLATKPGLFPRPATIEQAAAQVSAWLAQPSAQIVQPTARHATVLSDLLSQTNATGNLVTDGHLAALAIEHRATVVSYDSDFDRFPGVRWERPTS